MYSNREKYALVGGVVLDGTRDMTPRTGLAVCVDGGRISAVCAEDAVPPEYTVVDLHGKYLLPGLINLHVHLPASGKPKKKPSDPKKLVKLITSNGLMRRIGVKMCEGYARTELVRAMAVVTQARPTTTPNRITPTLPISASTSAMMSWARPMSLVYWADTVAPR